MRTSYGVSPGVRDYDNPFDEIEAGDYPVMSDPIVVAQGQNLVRGAVLGRVTATKEYVLSAKAAADGSQKPVGILAYDVDATVAATRGERLTSGHFVGPKLTLGAGWTVEEISLAFEGTPIHIAERVL